MVFWTCLTGEHPGVQQDGDYARDFGPHPSKAPGDCREEVSKELRDVLTYRGVGASAWGCGSTLSQ